MELVKKYSLNVINKALEMDLKPIKQTNEYIVLLAPSKHSKNAYYRITYNKFRDEFNCECQEFKHKRKCSHTLKAVKYIKGDEAFWKEASTSKLKT